MPEPERHVFRLVREPALDAVLTIDGKPFRIVTMKITPDITRVVYEELTRDA